MIAAFLLSFVTTNVYAAKSCVSDSFWSHLRTISSDAKDKTSGLNDRISGFNQMLSGLWPDLVFAAQTDPALNSLLYKLSSQSVLANTIDIDPNTYQNLGVDPFGSYSASTLTRRDITFDDVRDNAEILLSGKPSNSEDMSPLEGNYASKNFFTNFISKAFAGSAPWTPNGIGFSAGFEALSAQGPQGTFGEAKRLRVGMGATVYADFMEAPNGEWNLNLGIGIQGRQDLWPVTTATLGEEARVGYGFNYYTSMEDQTFDFKCYNGARYPYNSINLMGTLLSNGGTQKIYVGVGLFPNWTPQKVGNTYRYSPQVPPTQSGNKLLDQIGFAFMQKANGISNPMSAEPVVPDDIFIKAKSNLPTYAEAQIGSVMTPRDPSRTSFLSNFISSPVRQSLNLSPCIRFSGILSKKLNIIPSTATGMRIFIVPSSVGTFFNGGETNGLSFDNLILGASAVTGAAVGISASMSGVPPEQAFWAGIAGFLTPMAPAVVQAGYCASGMVKAFTVFGSTVSAKCVDHNMQFSTKQELVSLATVIDKKLKEILPKSASGALTAAEKNVLDGYLKLKQSISGMDGMFSGWYK